MVIGYEVKMYSDITRIANALERLERTMERSILIAGLLPTVLPMDISEAAKLEAAADAVDNFLKAR